PSIRCEDNEILPAVRQAAESWSAAFEGYRLQEAAAAIRQLVTRVDGYIQAKEPWKIVKERGVTDALHRIHHNCLEGLRAAAVLAARTPPTTATEVLRRLAIDKKAEDLRASDLSWGGLPLDAPLAPAPPLFPRADAKEYFGSTKESTVASDSSGSVGAPSP